MSVEPGSNNNGGTHGPVQRRSETLSSPQLRESLTGWLHQQEDLVSEELGRVEDERPDPLAPIDQQVAFMGRVARLRARAEILTEVRELLERCRGN